MAQVTKNRSPSPHATVAWLCLRDGVQPREVAASSARVREVAQIAPVRPDGGGRQPSLGLEVGQVVRDRTVQLMLVIVGQAAVVVGERVLRIDLDGLVEVGERTAEVALAVVGVAVALRRVFAIARRRPVRLRSSIGSAGAAMPR